MSEFMPLPAAFLDAVAPGDRFLVCYPRSGARWITLLLTDVVNQLSGNDPWPVYEDRLRAETGQPRPVIPSLRSESVVPDAYRQPHGDHAASADYLKPLYKSHHLTRILERGTPSIVYLFRRPEASLVSYYFYAVVRHPDAVRGISIDEFCRNRIGDWTAHVAEALRTLADRGDRALFLQYQDREPFDERQLAAVCSFLELNATTSTISAAVSNFRRFLARLNAIWSHATRRGANAGVDEILESQTLARIRSLSECLFDAAARIAARQLEERAAGRRAA